MNIRIPKWLWRLWNGFGDWANVTIYRRGRIELRRIDVIVAVAFVACVGYYWITSGWYMALLGGTMFVFMALVALWFF